jgi:hypothetical protein
MLCDPGACMQGSGPLVLVDRVDMLSDEAKAALIAIDAPRIERVGARCVKEACGMVHGVISGH